MPLLFNDYDFEDPATRSFVALLTSAGSYGTSGQNTYDWTEQDINPATGNYQNALNGRSGTISNGPWCFEYNNTLVNTPKYVDISLSSYINGQGLYTFLSPAGSAVTQTLLAITTSPITGIVGNQFGQGTAELQKIPGGLLTDASTPVEIYNKFAHVIPVGVTVTLNRDPYTGLLWVVEPDAQRRTICVPGIGILSAEQSVDGGNTWNIDPNVDMGCVPCTCGGSGSSGSNYCCPSGTATGFCVSFPGLTGGPCGNETAGGPNGGNFIPFGTSLTCSEWMQNLAVLNRGGGGAYSCMWFNDCIVACTGCPPNENGVRCYYVDIFVTGPPIDPDQPSGKVILNAGCNAPDQGYAQYEASSVGWDCQSSLTLSLVSSTDVICSNFPSSVTITPMPNPVPENFSCGSEASGSGGSGSGGACNQTPTLLTTGSGTSSPLTITVPGTVPAGALLTVQVGYASVETALGVTFNGTAMQSQRGSTNSPVVGVQEFSLAIVSPVTTGSLVVTATTAGLILVVVQQIVGLTNNTSDLTGASFSFGNNSAPETGFGNPTTNACEYSNAAAMTFVPNTYLWANGYENVAAVSGTLGGNPYTLFVGNRTDIAQATSLNALYNAIASAWSIVQVPYS